MLEFSNDDTLAIHITKACNLRCKSCYQQEYSSYTKDANIEYIHKAISKIKPKNIALYGGESLLKPNLCWEIINTHPNLGYILHTNGSIVSKKLLDRVDGIFFTLESFIYDKTPAYRRYTLEQWEVLMSNLRRYKDKAKITHNIYPDSNDTMFYDMAKLFGIKYGTYQIILNSSYCEYNLKLAKYLPRSNTVLDNPKLRLLENGMVTRDMRGVYNICHIDDWTDDKRSYRLPISNICKECKYFTKCPACNIFPHFCKDVLEKNNHPHFCKFTEALWKN